MPFIKFTFKPGINRESTSYSNEDGWFNSDLIRFRKGYPEKMGGWSKLSAATIQGTGRSMHIWSALDGAKYMGLGTESKFYIEEGGTILISPPYAARLLLAPTPLPVVHRGVELSR